MEKTVCELFAGVGGFRCGLNHIKTSEDTKKPEKWKTVWFNQWEPSEKNTQYAHNCYVYNFGTAKDLLGNYTTNISIEDVDKKTYQTLICWWVDFLVRTTLLLRHYPHQGE